MTVVLANARPRAAAIRVLPSWLAFALALAGTFALHAAIAGYRGGDDPFFIEVARRWLLGSPPYLAAFDVKPPGLFLLLAGMELVLGPTQAALNALTVLCEAGTAFCLWRIGRQLGAPAVGAFAAIAYPLLSQWLANNPGYPPLALATTGAFALATGGLGWRTRLVLAGFAIGFAATIKQTACLEAAPLLWLLLRERQAQDRRAGALGFVIAAAAAPLAFALVLAAQGAFAPLFDDVVVTALRRPGVEPESYAQIVQHFLSVQKRLLPLVVFAGIGVVRLRALLPGQPAGRAEGLALWLAVSWLELILQHARWALYLGPTFAPLLLLAGAGVASALRAPALRAIALAAVFLATAADVYPIRYWKLLGAENRPLYEETAKAILAQNPAPTDKMLAIGLLEGVELNTLTKLAPPTRYVYWLHLACDFPGAGPSRLAEAFAAKPRFVVAATDPFRPYCEDPSTWPLVHSALARDYAEVAATSQWLVYKRRDP